MFDFRLIGSCQSQYLAIDDSIIYVILPDDKTEYKDFILTLNDTAGLLPENFTRIEVIDEIDKKRKCNNMLRRSCLDRVAVEYCCLIARAKALDEDNFRIVVGNILDWDEDGIMYGIECFINEVQLANMGMLVGFTINEADLDQEDNSVPLWLRTSLKCIVERTNIELISTKEGSRGKLEKVIIRKKTLEELWEVKRGVGKIKTPYIVELVYSNGTTVIPGFTSSISECFYMLQLIATSAYNRNENGGLPSDINNDAFSNWLQKAIAELYPDGNNAKIIFNKLSDKRAMGYASCKSRAAFYCHEIIERKLVLKEKKSTDEFYKLNGYVPIELPDNLQALGLELKQLNH